MYPQYTPYTSSPYQLFHIPSINEINSMHYIQNCQFMNKQYFNNTNNINYNIPKQVPLQIVQKIEEQSEVEWNVQSETSNPEHQIKIEDDSEEIPNSADDTPQIRQLIKLTTYIPKIEYKDCKGKQTNGQATRKIQKRKSGKTYQDTKNVPKNFGKAIMKYIKEHQEDAQKLLGAQNDFHSFFRRISNKKDKIISIKEFKTLFVENGIPSIGDNGISLETLKQYNKVYRILAYKFIRTEFQSYLYSNKKIKHGSVMNKYRNVLQLGLQKPSDFISWKQQE